MATINVQHPEISKNPLKSKHLHSYIVPVSTNCQVCQLKWIVTENGGEFSMQIDEDNIGNNDGCGYNAELEQVWKQAFLHNKHRWLMVISDCEQEFDQFFVFDIFHV